MTDTFDPTHTEADDDLTSLTGDGAPPVDAPPAAAAAPVQDNVSTPGVQRTTYPDGSVSEHGEAHEQDAEVEDAEDASTQSTIDPGPDGHQDQTTAADGAAGDGLGNPDDLDHNE